MSKVPERLPWVLIAGLGLALASVLTFLYTKTHANDGLSYFENVALLHQIKQIDTQWELDALKSKIGINTDYDRLVVPLTDLNSLKGKLDANMAGREHAGADVLLRNSVAFNKALYEKTRLVEQFKSHNSMLRNSLTFIPTAADDIRKSLRKARGIDEAVLTRVSDGVNETLLATMIYSQTVADGKAAGIAAALDRLAADKEYLPAAIGEELEIYASHVGMVLREHRIVNELLSMIGAVPTMAHIDEIDHVLSSEQTDADIQAYRYHQYLLIFSTALIALFLYAATRLIRDRAVIASVNRKLQSVNERLEEQVQQRTHKLQDQSVELKLTNEALQRDIIKRKQMEAELKLAASVFHNTMDGAFVTNLSAEILSVNPAFTAITGHSAAEVLGRKANLLHCERHEPDFYTELWNTLRSEGRWEGEMWSIRKNGEFFLSRVSICAVAGEDGKPERYVSVFNDVTEARRKDEHIRHLAFHDLLTGLSNRALLLNRLEHSIAFALRENEHLAVMFIDLDRFKTINDSLGHNIGDSLLKEVASRLRQCVRRSDTVARMGGDEFVIVIEHAGAPEAYASMAQKIIANLSRPMMLEGRDVQIGASIGIARYPDDGSDANTLMKHADAAMYAAKSAGRGTYRFFQAAMTEKAEQRFRFEMELRNAVVNGELELFYQPKVSLATRVPFGVEALVRWRHPVMGLVRPAEFIPMAEETGIICDLGDWVLEEACRRSRAWQDQGIGGIKIAVNVSAKQLEQTDLVARISGLVRKYGISPRDIEVELTESVIMANLEEISDVFTRLRKIGVTVTMDDFGTGYSSLAYLRRLPIDVLKIDRSFVMRADHDEGDGRIVRTIIELAQALNLEVVAEGVETENQAAFLRSCGCPSAQGYLYSIPRPAAEIETWLKGRLDSKDD